MKVPIEAPDEPKLRINLVSPLGFGDISSGVPLNPISHFHLPSGVFVVVSPRQLQYNMGYKCLQPLRASFFIS